jgi:predicted nucleotidyltransferase
MRCYTALMEGSPAGVRLPAIVEMTLHAFVAGVRERFGARVAEIRLFGSYARGDATAESDVDCLVLLDRVERDDDRAITDLAADLTWQIAGVVVSPMIMSVAEFEAWKGLERRTPLEIERQGIPL